MRQIRIFFSKVNSAKYISHLDLMRCFERSMRRAGIPIWYTEGFNPRPFLTFALPLSLGTSGLRESVDLRLERDMDLDEVKTRLNNCLPNGLCIIEVKYPVKKNTAIRASRYSITISKASDASGTLKLLDEYLSRESIIISKLNKKKQTVDCDLKPYVKEYKLKQNNEDIILSIVLSSGCTENCNPSLLLDGFFSSSGIPKAAYSIVREDVLDEELRPFA